MPRYELQFTLSGRIEVDARDEAHAQDIFDGLTFEDLAMDCTSVETTNIEKVDDYGE